MNVHALNVVLALAIGVVVGAVIGAVWAVYVVRVGVLIGG